MALNEEAVLTFARSLTDRRIEFQCSLDAGNDGFVRSLSDNGKTLYIRAGNVRGVLYGVYDFLEKGGASGAGSPEFSIRGSNPCESLSRHTPEQLKKFIDRCGRWRFNTMIIHTQYGYWKNRKLIEEECAKRGIELVFYTYCNLAFCKYNVREDFARREDGSIIPPGDKLECVDRLCASNPEGLARYRQGVTEYLAEHPELDDMMFATSDGFDYCRCGKCSRLDPVEQCDALFNIFFDAASDRRRELLIYYLRYHLPRDLKRVKQLDKIMFDAHPRDRNFRLKDPEGKSVSREPGLMAAGDERASKRSCNAYLYDRLREWRENYSGKLYVFENLMMQCMYGVPTFNLKVYLQDLRDFAALGVDGVVYEAFEPGINGMLPVLNQVARAMWDLRKDWFLTPEQENDRPDYAEFYRLVHACRREKSPGSYIALMDYLLSRPDREEFDYRYIGFNALWNIQKKHGSFRTGDKTADLFMSTRKLWDFMEKTPDPLNDSVHALQKIIQYMKTTGK